jgi:hypothetical protein
MRGSWTREQINELRQLLVLYPVDDYIREHLSYLNNHLKKHDKYKSPIQRQEAWKAVEYEADNVETRLEILENAKKGDFKEP